MSEEANSAVHPSVVILTPVKDGERHLDRYVELIERLDWPRERLSVGLLEGDSRDGAPERPDQRGEAPA